MVLGLFIDRKNFLVSSDDDWTGINHMLVNGEPYGGLVGKAAGYYCEMRIYPNDNRANVIITINNGITNQNYLDRIENPLL